MSVAPHNKKTDTAITKLERSLPYEPSIFKKISVCKGMTSREYWQTHDDTFMQKANLTRFNPTILDYDIKQENDFFVEQLVHAPKNSKMLDLGAYKGDTCIPVAEKLKKAGRNDIEVIAFEPNKKYCDHINKIASDKSLNLSCVQSALSDKTQTLHMKKDEGSGTMYDTMFTGEAVSSQPLDNFKISNVSLMKIDVEGHEDQVLRGAQETLATTHKLYVEMWNDEHYNKRHTHHGEGSHNQRILEQIPHCEALQKIEKNVFFECN